MGAILCCCKIKDSYEEPISSGETLNTDLQNRSIAQRNNETIHNTNQATSVNANTGVRRPRIHNSSSTLTRNTDSPNRIISQGNNATILNTSHAISVNANTGIKGPWIHNRTSDRGNSSIIHSTTRPNLKKVKYDPNYFPYPNLETFFSNQPIYSVLPIPINTAEYWKIKKRITNKYFIVHSIDIIRNTFFEISYLLKKKQKLTFYPYLEELELFHGTKWEYVDSICKNNFNWRYTGKEVGNRYGRGVCFSCNAMYAANYSDQDEDERVMLIARVLVGRKCVGKYNMKLPPAGCDTSTKQSDNIVVVKYEDNEFYPIYRIKYHIAPGYVPMNKRNLKMN